MNRRIEQSSKRLENEAEPHIVLKLDKVQFRMSWMII